MFPQVQYQTFQTSYGFILSFWYFTKGKIPCPLSFPFCHAQYRTGVWVSLKCLAIICDLISFLLYLCVNVVQNHLSRAFYNLNHSYTDTNVSNIIRISLHFLVKPCTRDMEFIQTIEAVIRQFEPYCITCTLYNFTTTFENK